MPVNQLFLIIVSSLGVIHGLFLALFLWTSTKGNRLSNRILGILLTVLSFRVGKSVILEFTENLDIKLIFIGLATLMAIGPLFYGYTRSYIDKPFQIKVKHWLHFVPAVLGICLGFWVDHIMLNTFPKVFFALTFAVYYGHYLAYLLISYSQIKKSKKTELSPNTQALLRLLFFGLLAVWMVYVLNLFDEFIPYIIGPILYSLIAYVISFIVIQKGYLNDKTKYKTTFIANGQVDDIFKKMMNVINEEKLFTNPDITLMSLSKRLNISTQALSMVINKQSNMNFNGFINRFRVEEAIEMFQNQQYNNYTIAAIAFEAGFNSISSFNTAFKKQTGKTPLIFRKELTK